MAYAEVSDVAVRLGRELSPEELTLVQTRLEDVERLILRRIPDLDVQITAGDLNEDDVIQVEADAVGRLVRNPDGFISEGDGNYTYTRDASKVSGCLELQEYSFYYIPKCAAAALLIMVVV